MVLSWGIPRLEVTRPEIGKRFSVKGVLAEDAFRRVLEAERSRSDRSHRPFVLLLLNIGRLLSTESGRGSLPIILSLLQSATRETDVLGWNETAASIGVILTEIVLGAAPPINAISARLSTALQQKLTAQQFNQIGLSFQQYPEVLVRGSQLCGTREAPCGKKSCSAIQRAGTCGAVSAPHLLRRN